MVTFLSLLLGSLVIFLMSVGPALAAGSGAYRLEVPDAGAAGKGSAFVGEANNPSAVYWNPAGMTQLEGNNISVGAALVQPFIDYENNAGAESQKQRHNFGIPSAYFVSDLGSEKFSLGLGALSSWGLATEWHADSFARYNATKTVMENHDYLISGAYQVNDHLSLALSLDIDSGFVDKQKKVYQQTADANMRLRGEDDGYGYRIAGMYRINERHQFGLMYRSKIDLKYKGKVTLEGMNNTYDALSTVPGTQTYAGIFGGTNYETDVEAKMTLPQGILLGYSYKPTQKWTFNVDLEWTDWSATEYERVTYPSESNALRLAVLNNGNPAPRDWASVLSGAVGAEYKMTDRLRVRGGGYYHQSPIPGDTWTPNLPDADSFGVATGFGYDLSKALTFDFAWSGLFFKDRVIDNTVADATGGIDGTYRQWVNLVYASVTYKF